MSFETEQDRVIDRREQTLITRREAIRRVSALLGGIALVGGDALLTGCRDDRAGKGGAGAKFSDEEVAFLDEVAETILPQTNTPGAKAAGVGPFMALMVNDTYDERDQEVFREGMRKLDEASEKMHGAAFLEAAPQQRLALLEQLDREQKRYTDAREAARKRKPGEPADTAKGMAHLPDQRQESAPVGEGEANPAPAITADAPAHYFRMMKELTLLGYFTSEIGYNQAQRYAETPGRFDPCIPYQPGERAWAPHA
jgi:hypothetical protein